MANLTVSFKFATPKEKDWIAFEQWCWRNKITLKEKERILDIITRMEESNE